MPKYGKTKTPAKTKGMVRGAMHSDMPMMGMKKGHTGKHISAMKSEMKKHV